MQEQDRARYSRRRHPRGRGRATVLVTLAASLLVSGVALASDTTGADDGDHLARQLHPRSLSAGATSDRGAPREPVDLPQPTATVATPSSSPSPTEPPETEEPESPSGPPDSDEPEPTPTDEESDEPDDDYEDPGHTGEFPTMESTGPRISVNSMKDSESITSDNNGQLIEGLNITSRIKIVHDDVTVRNVRINHVAQQTGQYALQIAEKSNGSCPDNVVIENIEIVGDTSVLNDSAKTVYSECPFTLRGSRIYDVGTGVRIVHGSRIEGNFIHANFFTPGSGTHRSGMGLNGGSDHVISGNTIECEGTGCSGAFVMYGDFAQVDNVLIEHNLFNTTGSYCTYAGSLDSKPNPVANNVRYIGNHFGRKFFDTCGRYGPVAGRDSGGGTGFVWGGNVWADTGEPVG